jgi:hypothetical protein
MILYEKSFIRPIWEDQETYIVDDLKNINSLIWYRLLAFYLLAKSPLKHTNNKQIIRLNL